MEIAEGHRIVSWEDIGKALSEKAGRWAEYLSVHGSESRIEEWYVSMLDHEADQATDGNIGVQLLEMRPEGIEIAYTDDFMKRVLRVVAPPLREVHNHECDGCGASFACYCADAGQERADCGGCKREDLE